MPVDVRTVDVTEVSCAASSHGEQDERCAYFLAAAAAAAAGDDAAARPTQTLQSVCGTMFPRPRAATIKRAVTCC